MHFRDPVVQSLIKLNFDSILITNSLDKDSSQRLLALSFDLKVKIVEAKLEFSGVLGLKPRLTFNHGIALISNN